MSELDYTSSFALPRRSLSKKQAVAYSNVIDHMHYSLCMDPHLGNNLARLLEPFNLPATPLVVSLPARRLPFHY
jgi:hypothetical protein